MFLRLPIKYHREDNPNLSGAACGQMVLYSIGKGIPAQQQVAASIAGHNTESWNCDPNGLKGALNALKPASFANHFVTYSENTPHTVSRKLVWTVYHYGVAPAALVFGSSHGYAPSNGHWVLVTSITTDKAPAGPTDTSYKILSFEIHNPWAATVQGAYQHYPTDKCGWGAEQSGKDWGWQFQYVAFSTPGGNGWIQNYMLPVPFQGSQWQGKYVAVCDPDAPGVDDTETPAIEATRILTAEEATEVAMEGLRQTGLVERDVWQHALAGTEPGDPILVERMDLPNHVYYIVPFQTNRDRVPVLVNVDAFHGGTLADSLAHPRGSTHFGGAMTRQRVLDELVGMEVEIDGKTLTLNADDLHPSMVWVPCRESESPYWPFHLFNVGHGDFTIFVRIDGAIFTELHGLHG